MRSVSKRLRRSTSIRCGLVWALGLVCGVVDSNPLRAAEAPILQSVKEIRTHAQERSGQELKVKFQGVVAARLRIRQLIFVVDGSEAVSVFAPGTNSSVVVGQHVEVEGVTVATEGVHCISEKITKFGDPGPPPAAEKISVPMLKAGDEVLRWVKLTGMVQSVRFGRGRTSTRAILTIRDRGESFPVSTRRIPGLGLDDYRYSQVEASGFVIRVEAGAVAGTRMLWVDSTNSFEILRAGPKFPFKRAVRQIREMADLGEKGRLPRNLMRLQGVVDEVEEGGGFWLKDQTGRIRCESDGPSFLRAGDATGIVGIAAHGSNDVFMVSCRAQLLGLPGGGTNRLGLADLTNGIPVLTQLGDVLDVAEEDLSRRLPVRLRAFVSHVASPTRVFIRSISGGVEVATAALEKLPEPGDRLEVDGFVDAGDRGAVIRARRVEKVTSGAGLASRLPKPLRINYGGILSGRFLAQWVSNDGIVRRIERSENALDLTLVRTGVRLVARLNLDDEPPPEIALGAKVLATGVGEGIDGRGGQRSLRILVPSPENLSVDTPAENNAAGAEVIRIGDLVEASAGRITKARRIEGVVTYRDRDYMYVADKSGSIEVVYYQDGGATVGDRVAVTGYPVLGGAKPFLEDAIVRRSGEGGLVSKAQLHARDVLLGDYHGRLLALSGRLVGRTTVGRDFVMMVDDGTRTFQAVMNLAEMSPRVAAIEENSQVNVTGVCRLRLNRRDVPESFRLLLRNENDVELLAAAPWWTGERLVLVVGGLVIVVLGSLAWINFLRRRIEQTQGRFATAFQASPVPVAIVTIDDYRFINVNQSFLKQFEFRRPQVLGKTANELDLFGDKAGFKKFVDALKAKTSLQDFEGEVMTATGRMLRVILSAERIDLDGEDCMLVLIQDVTERVQLMGQLRESQKMEAIGQLAAGVAHDFNNLLTIIRGNSELIRMMIDEESDVAELNGEMDQAARRAAELTRQLLAFSRKQVMCKAVIDLNSTVIGSTKILQRLLGEKISVHYELAPATLPMVADAGMIDQIIMNLAVNAKDAMPDGGTLTLRTVDIEFTEANKPARPDSSAGEFVVLEIQDSGEGMDEQTQKRIFEPFFTTKEVGKGTGLGLSTVYGIVSQHKGWIELQSEYGEGTKFSIYLPASDSRDLKDGPRDSATEFFRGSETVMVVEDDAAVRRMMARTLEGSGYEVLSAEDGLVARELWAEARQRVDLLVTDMVMPNGVSGLDVAREFAADRPDLAVVFVSGYTEESISDDEQLPAGFEFVTKPFTRDQLLAAVRKRLNEPREELQSAG